MTGLESLNKLREKNQSGDKKEYFDAIEKELKDYKLLANEVTELVLTNPFKKLDSTQTNLYNIIINLLYDKKGLDIEEEEKNENIEIPQEVWKKVLNELELLRKVKEEMKWILMNTDRPIKNTTKKQCYIALANIQEILETNRGMLNENN